jgi:hypothetical protein
MLYIKYAIAKTKPNNIHNVSEGIFYKNPSGTVYTQEAYEFKKYKTHSVIHCE